MMVEEQAATANKPSAPPTLPEVANLDEARQLIVEHPVATVAGAFALGALLGLLRPNNRGGILRTAISGIAMAMVREAVLKRVSSYAGSWIDHKSREEAASRQRETESFLEH